MFSPQQSNSSFIRFPPTPQSPDQARSPWFPSLRFWSPDSRYTGPLLPQKTTKPARKGERISAIEQGIEDSDENIAQRDGSKRSSASVINAFCIILSALSIDGMKTLSRAELFLMKALRKVDSKWAPHQHRQESALNRHRSVIAIALQASGTASKALLGGVIESQ